MANVAEGRGLWQKHFETWVLENMLLNNSTPERLGSPVRAYYLRNQDSQEDALRCGIQYLPAAQHLGQLREPREGVDQVLDSTGTLTLSPQVVRAAWHHRLGADGRLLDACSPIGLDDCEQRLFGHRDLEGMDVVGLIDGHYYGVRLLDSLRNVPTRRLRLAGQHLLAYGVDGLALQLVPHLQPPKMFPNASAGRVEAVP